MSHVGRDEHLRAATGELCVEVAPPTAISQDTCQGQDNPEHSEEEEALEP